MGGPVAQLGKSCSQNSFLERASGFYSTDANALVREDTRWPGVRTEDERQKCCLIVRQGADESRSDSPNIRNELVSFQICHFVENPRGPVNLLAEVCEWQRKALLGEWPRL